MWTVVIILTVIVILGCVGAWGPWEDARHRDKER